MQRPKRLLVDVDGLLWRYALAPRDSILEFDGSHYLRTPKDIAEETLMAIEQKVDYLGADLGATEVHLVFMPQSSKGLQGFRQQLYPQYKAHRPEVPEVVREAYRLLYQRYNPLLPHEYTPDLESDDLCGLLQDLDGATCIVSGDKDLLTVPGWNYNPFVRDRGMRWVSQGAADVQLLMQLLTGDTSDGYPGVPGIGPVMAEGILAQAIVSLGTCCFRKLFPVVHMTYRLYGLTLEELLRNLQLAAIRCHSHRLFTTELPEEYKEVLQWI